MKLYFSRGACSLSPHIVLREAELSFELESVDLANKLTASGRDYKTINPNGYVPALQLDNGEVLTEGPAIIQYLADLVPEKKLAPANGTLARVRLQEWLNFIATELHKSFGALFNEQMPESVKSSVRAQLAKRFEYVSSRLSGRDYLLGEFSVADAYLYTILNWCGFVGVDLAQWPVLAGFKTRIGARPSVAAAKAAEK